MKIMFDTSVLVAALAEHHPNHGIAFPWLQRAASDNDNFIIAAHTLAELYAVLTRLPVSPKIQPDMARMLIRENIEKHIAIVTLDQKDYLQVLDNMSDSELSGGIIYDALLVQTARKSGIDILLTFNSASMAGGNRHY